MKNLNVALAGYGWWGRKMATLITGRATRLRIAVVVEPGDEARRAAEEAGHAAVADLAEALARPDVDAVILATPHVFHAEQIRLAAAAGKHIFCEKPLALTEVDAVAAVRLCAERGLVLGIGHERRFEPPMAALLEACRAGDLGRIVQIEANFSHDKFVHLAAGNWRLDPAHAPLAGMTATGIHLTDLAIAILGRPVSVSAYCDRLVSTIPQGDTLGALVTFEGGGNAYISASLGVPFVSRFAVYGSKGWREIRDKSHVENPTGWLVLASDAATGLTNIEEAPAAEAVLDNLEAFARAALGEAAYPIATADMVANTALLEKMGAAVASGGAVRF
ncbi:Gfo/Idh/MocA family protein [Segnochrobactrum spirostomi]|uniref:Gfo/Idh/MocA family oxidoreductase n=1 Tax=Segnochrobactrum spirostomi TaxID=2608987 RepID=A0A6A7YBI7_9HYPH|nr:Gfo/Idh/MocA family oxidoreductase [Segnochrobactrum spirostomi]MQT14779.1 Gfo/Idh/MocA family oxidoreductase [Segnochrobactrum spirostomi]